LEDIKIAHRGIIWVISNIMSDSRYVKLAHLLVSHSTELVKGERVLIHTTDVPDAFVSELIKTVRAVGAYPVLMSHSSRLLRQLILSGDQAYWEAEAKLAIEQLQTVAAYISIRGNVNTLETSDVPAELMRVYQTSYGQPVTDYRVNHTRWCALRWPNPSFAQAAGMSTDAFEDFYFDVCTLDYGRMATAAEPLRDLMEKTDRVRILGPGTDLSFSIKGIGARMSFGKRNVPDGECFSCPTIGSTNGVISYNAPTVYAGKPFSDIRLELKDGLIVNATSSDTDSLNHILDTDEGARRIGEFAIGYNPVILNPMRDVLFDEKIAGSLHFTPGNAYASPGNGNRSGVHWDMVLIQRPEWGGGEIWFDDVLIRKDGMFVLEHLQGLNPERLLG
jgi:aminopeptidase